MNGNELESLTRDWAGVASSIKWEDDLVLTVAGKMFAVYCLRGPHRERVSFKVDPGRFLELTDQPGIAPAAYMARAFWISINEPDRFARAKLEEFVRHSYDLVRGGLSKKQQAALAAKERPATSAEGELSSATLATPASSVRARKTAGPAPNPVPGKKARRATPAAKGSSARSSGKTAKPAKSAVAAKKPAPPPKRAAKARD